VRQGIAVECPLCPDHDAGIRIASMAQRAADLGGTCTVRSGPAGTTVTAHPPVRGT
jgi:signal transduction histidine kinase